MGRRVRIGAVRTELTILCVRLGLARALLAAIPAFGAAEEPRPDPAAALDAAMAAAEERLRAGETGAAQAHYGEALFQGWMLEATLERLDGHSTEAATAARNAAAWAKDGDAQGQRLLGKTLATNGDADGAARALDAAAAAATDDPEMTFMVATDFLWMKRIEAAERLFAQLLRMRPAAATHVLVGHAYRDAGEYARARLELRAALDQEPGVRRAHYYLGTVVLADPASGGDRSGLAIAELQAEVKLSPDDALAWDQLGTSLLDAGQAAEGIQAIERAVGLEARVSYVYHLGRCQLALDRPADAVASSRRALALGGEQGATESELERIHYQLGLALRKTGAGQEAAAHLAEAKRIAARWTEAPPAEKPFEPAPASALPASDRQGLAHRVRASLAQAYLNLGVMQAQADHLSEALELFEKAAEADPDFPQVQYSLGIARFNARQFDKATDPLTRALATSPGDARLKRALAMAWLNSGSYTKAAALLERDPGRAGDPSLQFAYGLALAHGGREAEAEAIFTKLIRENGESAEVSEALRQLESRH